MSIKIGILKTMFDEELLSIRREIRDELIISFENKFYDQQQSLKNKDLRIIDLIKENQTLKMELEKSKSKKKDKNTRNDGHCAKSHNDSDNTPNKYDTTNSDTENHEIESNLID